MMAIGPIRLETGRPMLLAGLRRTHLFSDAEQGIVEQWRAFKSTHPLPNRVGSNLYGALCGADATSMEYMCGVEVESLAGLPEGIGRMRIPAQRYAVFEHSGAASALRSTWQKVFEWLSGGEYQSAHAPDFELYQDGIDPLSTSGGIEVWVGVVPR